MPNATVKPTAWRGGLASKTRSRKQMLLRYWSTESSQRFASNGRPKTGKRSPKPVTLATVKLPDLEGDQ